MRAITLIRSPTFRSTAGHWRSQRCFTSFSQPTNVTSQPVSSYLGSFQRRSPTQFRYFSAIPGLHQADVVSTTESSDLPLSGYLVVSLEQAIAGPYCTRQLADLGARIIKV